jgi:predicted translin family RNA/ssDNA-binding protein
MVDAGDFGRMKKELELFDSQREGIIKRSRDILADSKHAIYCVHRDDMKKAHELLGRAKGEIGQLRKIISRFSEMESIGAFSSAVQEHVEALAFHSFVSAGRLPTKKETGASTEDYLMGICDFTGELARRAVLLASKKDYGGIEKIKDMVDEINGQLLQFNFRNGELRKKYDSVKWNLKKIEDVFYDISIRGLK